MFIDRTELLADLKYCKDSLSRIIKYTERNYSAIYGANHTVIQKDIIKLRRDLNEVNLKLNWYYYTESEDK